MAESVTRTLPAPFIEAAGVTLTEALTPLLGQKIDTSKFAPQVAGESTLQQQARTGAAGLGSLLGPSAYQQFYSPYQQDVINTTEAALQRQKQKGLAGLQAQAVGLGAFGGAREGVAAGEYLATQDIGAQQLLANLRQQGFQSAQEQALKQLQAQQGLGTYQTQLGQAGQAQQQAILDAAQVAAKEATYEPFTRLGLVGQQLAQIQPGAFPTQSVGYQQPQAPVSPLSTALGVGTGIASIGSKLGLFG